MKRRTAEAGEPGVEANALASVPGAAAIDPALAALVAHVAHDVRNPIFGITATLDAFEARFPGHPEFARYLEVLREQARNALGVLDDLVEYGRPGAPAPASHELAGALRDAQAACRELLERRATRLRLETPLELLPPLHVDRTGLTKALARILSHLAAQAPHQSEIRVHAAADDAWLECRLAAPGPPLAPPMLTGYLAPFATKHPGGSGLSLTLAERALRDSGGRLAVEPTPGGGVTFLLRVALHDRTGEAP